MEKVKEFVYFISRSTILQDVVFGTKTLKHSSGESLSIPALVCTMTTTKPVHQKQEECKHLFPDKGSVQCFKGKVSAGAQGFQTLESLVDTVRNGAGVARGREIGRVLAGKESTTAIWGQMNAALTTVQSSLYQIQRNRNSLLLETTATICPAQIGRKLKTL